MRIMNALIILFCFLFFSAESFSGGRRRKTDRRRGYKGWEGSRPKWRDAAAMTKILLPSGSMTGSRFSHDRWVGHTADGKNINCDCQGLCCWGRGADEWVVKSTNKRSGLKGGWSNPSKSDDKILRCYTHTCNHGYISVCKEGKDIDWKANSYRESNRPCVCTQIAGKWIYLQQVNEGTEITLEVYSEKTKSETKTTSNSISVEAEKQISIMGVGVDVTTGYTREWSTAVENSITKGQSRSVTITPCAKTQGTALFQYYTVAYDPDCHKHLPKLLLEKRDGWIGRFDPKCMYSMWTDDDWYHCTESRDEPPCCGPGQNPISPNDRLFCRENYSTWTGQCDAYRHRTKYSSMQESNFCHQKFSHEKCSTRDTLGTCPNICGGNNAYANVFNPTSALQNRNMFPGFPVGSRDCPFVNVMDTFQELCSKTKSYSQVVYAMNKDWTEMVGDYSNSLDFDSVVDRIYRDHNRYEMKFRPVYYNDWTGLCGACEKYKPSYEYEILHSGLCPPAGTVKSVSECESAAKALNLRWSGISGDWRNAGDFSGCFFADDSRKTVFFNTAKNFKGSAAPFAKFYSMCRKGSYERLPKGRLCATVGLITTVSECQTAAKALNLVWSGVSGDWRNAGDFSGCLFADDSRKQVFFNTAPNFKGSAAPNANFNSVCRQGASGEESFVQDNQPRLPRDYDSDDREEEELAELMDILMHLN